MPPIRVNFEIPYFTVSGIQARILLALSLLSALTPSNPEALRNAAVRRELQEQRTNI
jgi:hypothetical protein